MAFSFQVPSVPPSASPRPQFAGYLACALAGTFWGMGFFFGKLAFLQLGVGHYVLYRFLFACAGILPFIKAPDFSRREWTLLLAASFCGIPLQFMIQFSGLKLTTVSHAAMMVGTMPVLLAAGATVFANERLDVKGWIALLGSTAGVALIVLSGKSGTDANGNIWGDLLVVLSLLIALAWLLLNQNLMAGGRSPLAVTGWGIASGTIMLALWVVATDGPPPVHGITAKTWIAVACSGVLSTAASTLLWNWGMHRVPASRAGVFLNIEPALGSVLGVAFLGDHLGLSALAGGALIIAAAIVLTTSGRNYSDSSDSTNDFDRERLSSH
jgi:drug/metabolite transporter (DMT)-like permease